MLEISSSIKTFHPWSRLDRVPRFSPKDLMYPVAEWVDDRPAMRHVNSAIEFMVLRILEEIGEVLEALNLGDMGLEHAKELNDLFFFLASLAHNLGKLEEIHLPSVSNQLNGLGAQDNIFDKMREVAGNMGDKRTVMRDLNWLISAWMSYWKHGPVESDPVFVMKKVLEKNGTKTKGNHPAMYYSGRDPYTGEVLTPDEMYEQFIHSRSMLRTLRMATGNQTIGLQPEHHLPFRFLIEDFRNSPQALAELMQHLTLAPEISEHLIGYYQHASVNHVTSYHEYSRKHAGSQEEVRILIPQPGLGRGSRLYH